MPSAERVRLLWQFQCIRKKENRPTHKRTHNQNALWTVKGATGASGRAAGGLSAGRRAHPFSLHSHCQNCQNCQKPAAGVLASQRSTEKLVDLAPLLHLLHLLHLQKPEEICGLPRSRWFATRCYILATWAPKVPLPVQPAG
jgi:hypothetical protein